MKYVRLDLTETESKCLLGLLEDMAQDEDIECYSEEARQAIRTIIKQLGGTYYGRL